MAPTIKIGIIDSGINFGFLKKHKINVIAASGLSINHEKKIIEIVEFEESDIEYLQFGNYPDIGDESGHGTAVLSIIWQNYPDAQFVISKVLRGDDRGCSQCLLEAFRWMIANFELNAINISIGTFDNEIKEEFYDLTLNAKQKNTKIFAALRQGSIPGCFDTVNSVSGEEYSTNDIIGIETNFNENENNFKIFYKDRWIKPVKLYPSWQCAMQLRV